MQDANTLTWTSASARADEVALGHPQQPVWNAPIPAEQAFAAQVGPKASAVHARANHGRWIVDCPDCSNAQMACPSDHRFMCNECANALNGGFWRPVIWPKNRPEIDKLLMVRPLANRNWDPGETVVLLKLENKANGVG
jgi:hypothetical protein